MNLAYALFELFSKKRTHFFLELWCEVCMNSKVQFHQFMCCVTHIKKLCTRHAFAVLDFKEEAKGTAWQLLLVSLSGLGA